ncbi:MAG: hypothetical protein QM796_00740 [Chthoniobacteraceae bacterium]
MVRSIILSLFFSAATLLADPIDFTPHQESISFDGGQMQRNYFTQGNQRISYDIPGGWTASGGGSRLTLTPPNKVQAQAVIECLPLSAPQTYNDAQAKLLKDNAMAFIPAKAENVKLVAEKLNDFKVDGHEVYEVSATYSFYGQNFELGVIYINMGLNQIRCHLVSHASDFNDLYAAFRRSFFSWGTM